MGGGAPAADRAPAVAPWVVVVAALLLAGCFGSGSGPDAAPGAEAGPNQTAGVNATPADEPTLAFEADASTATVLANGTFSAEEGSAVVARDLRDSDTRSHDLTAHVPEGAPVHVNVTITYSGENSQLNGELVLDGVEVFQQHYFKNFNTNTIWMEGTLARTGPGGTVEAIVQADLTGASAERSYELEARVQVFGSGPIPRVPVSVPATEASGGFVLEPVKASGLPSTMVWGPDGDPVKRGSGTEVRVGVGGDRAPGRYVVLAGSTSTSSAADPVPIRVRAANASAAPSQPLEVVGLETRQGDWHAVEPGSEASWTFNRSSPPARVALQARPVGAPAFGAGTGSALEATLASSAGNLVQASTGPFAFGSSEWLSPVGDANLVPGSYQATVTAGEATAYEASHVVYELAR